MGQATVIGSLQKKCGKYKNIPLFSPAFSCYDGGDKTKRRQRFPNLKCIARHVRCAHSGSENSLMAYMWYQGHTFESRLFTMKAPLP